MPSKGRNETQSRNENPCLYENFNGSTTFFVVILIIFAPLILFSYLNPLYLVNKVTGVNSQLILSIPTDYSQ